MALPGFLVTEMRAAFKSCAHQHHLHTRRFISSTVSTWKSNPNKTSGRSAPNHNWPYNGALAHPKSTGASSEMIPRQKDSTAVDTERRAPVPLRVIPKPDIGTGVRMTPRERLHIEVLTRQQPRKVEEKKIYREHLQIYHVGSLKENTLAILRVGCIVCACVTTFIVAPAHLQAGTDLWLVAFMWIGGFVPAVAIHYATKPMITRVFLNLPPAARDTSRAAIEYAKNLPRDASLEFRFLKPYAIEGKLQARVSELEPVSGNFVRPLAFQFKSKKKSPYFQPSSFYVWPQSAIGEKSKDTIPGLWAGMYKKLVRSSENTEMAKWKKP